MERGDSVLDAVYEDENLEYIKDVEMLDVEEGELVEENPKDENGDETTVKVVNTECHTDNPGQRKNKKKKKNKRKRGNSGQNVTNINRFVLDVCRSLKERKSYLVWAAVGCLGVSALGDLVTEVDAIQACGGQKTADNGRFRTGGGILWSILKARDPNAYKEIMRRGKEFEKQFNPHHIKQEPRYNKEDSSRRITCSLTDLTTAKVPDGMQDSADGQYQLEQSNGEKKRVSVHDRVRIPVAYDDLLEGETLGDG